MKLKKVKWVAALLPALFVGLFEMVRHEVLDIIPTGWGNLMVAGVAAITSLIYYHGIFTFIQNLHAKLQQEKEEKAILQERDRIARELHDSVSQALFYMNIKVKEMETSLEQQRQPINEVKELREAITIMDTDIRQHIFNLQLASQANVDMIRAIEAYVKHFQEQSGIKVELCCGGDVTTQLSSGEKNQLIRIFQEILWNIRKHAEAKRVKVSLTGEKHQLIMSIQDNGVGFDLTRLNEKESSFGLRILKERAEAIGAEVSLDSTPGMGTTVSIRLDCNHEEG